MSAMKNISLYIPHVFPNFDKEYVAKAFKNIGEVSQIDFVAKQDRNGKDFNAVYVHFNKWYTNKKAIAFYESVIDETKEARLIHDEPWYWIVLPNTAKKHVPGERKPRLDLGEAKAISTSNIAPILPVTPVKASATDKVCPGAPMKRSYAEAMGNQTKNPVEVEVTKSLQAEFDDEADFDEALMKFAEEIEDEAHMDEIEEMLAAEDENLIRIDGRYVQAIEEENWGMRAEIAQLRAALINLDVMYQAEVAKVRAFSSVDL
jgi:hypothetical protein